MVLEKAWTTSASHIPSWSVIGTPKRLPRRQFVWICAWVGAFATRGSEKLLAMLVHGDDLIATSSVATTTVSRYAFAVLTPR